MRDCCFRLTIGGDAVCLKVHQTIEPGFCDECQDYFPKAIIGPLTRAFNSMTREEQKQCLNEQYNSQARALSNR